jgi:dihydrofolate reductase
MRKLIYAINLTLDGCCDHTKVTHPDEKLYEYYTDLIRNIDVFIYGRKTYQLMDPYWPNIAKTHSGEKPENDYADVFDSKKKLVFSRTLPGSQNGNTRITQADLRDEILKLKNEEGKDLLTGGVSIPSQLIQLDLVDEFRFVVQPLIVGEGRRLLDEVKLPEILRLKLVESKTFDSGCVALHYVK